MPPSVRTRPGRVTSIASLASLAGVERGFDSGLGLVDFLTAGAALFGRELAEALHESRHGAAFADVLGLGVFQGSGLLCLSEVLTRGLDEFGKILHVH